MKYYMDIRIQPVEGISTFFLLSKIFDKLHLSFVKIAPEGDCPIGVGFPQYNAEGKSFGNVIRLFSDDKAAMESIQLPTQFQNYQDYLHVSSIREIPCVKKWMHFSRLHTHDQAYFRRNIRRGSLQDAPRAKKHPKLPFIMLNSSSTKNRFPLYIQATPAEGEQKGRFNCYGLSKATTVPIF